MDLSVASETGRLKGVIVHTPGKEVSLVNPELKKELLFDDIIFEEDARQEHLDMLQIFKTAMPSDGRIFEITDLFLECLQNSDARSFFIDLLIDTLREDNLEVIKFDLINLQPKELLQFVVEGRTPEIQNFSLQPTPNLLFTRDLAAVAGDSILLSRPARKARLRESLLMEMLVKYHPIFAGLKKKLIQTGPQQSIEGGDVLIASNKLVLIGMSERTSFSALMTAAEGLLDQGFEQVVAVDIPKKRSSMHLDTIFTFASEDECIAFPPAIMERKSNISVLTKQDGAIQSASMPSLKATLDELMERDITFIKCGGEERTNQFREQWTDGANVFALAPGVIVGYERNTNTFRTLEDHGYRVLTQYEFIEEFENEPFDPSGKKLAIKFMGHELCRGRGGARCMTMPILRDM
jgi:arginine deiminase